VYLKSKDHQSEIHQRIKLFKESIRERIELLDSRSAIQIILIPGNEKARVAARIIQQAGFDVRAILSPSVAEGSERLRICLHNHNSIIEIKNLCELLNEQL